MNKFGFSAIAVLLAGALALGIDFMGPPTATLEQNQ
jgi:hypothetical protein